jgi:hypothetical protein
MESAQDFVVSKLLQPEIDKVPGPLLDLGAKPFANNEA